MLEFKLIKIIRISLVSIVLFFTHALSMTGDTQNLSQTTDEHGSNLGFKGQVFQDCKNDLETFAMELETSSKENETFEREYAALILELETLHETNVIAEENPTEGFYETLIGLKDKCMENISSFLTYMSGAR
jgi:hypothetical protein